MSNTATESLTLWSILDRSISVPKKRSTEKSVSLYPSEASVKIVHNGETVVLGACLRKQWLRNKLQRIQRDKNHKPENLEIVFRDHDAPTMYKFGLGVLAEELIREETKRATIFVDSSVPFEWYLPWEDPDTDPPIVRGEVDLVVDLCRPKPVGLEIKSFAGYNASKNILDRTAYGKTIKGEPKEGQLLQGTLYAYYFCHLLDEYDHFRMIYISREDGQRNEFVISFAPEQVAVLQANGEIVEQTRQQLYVDGSPFKYQVYAEDIIDRYLQLHTHVVNDIIPDRDFELQYSKEKLKSLYEKGELSKAHTKEWETKGTIKKGDWQCKDIYCNYYSMCYDQKGKPIEYAVPDTECESTRHIDHSTGEKPSNSEIDYVYKGPLEPILGESIF